MAFKDNWTDLENAIPGVEGSGSDLTVEPINKIANAVIELEESGILTTEDKEEIIKEANEYVDEQHKDLWHDASFVACELVNSSIVPNFGPLGENRYWYEYRVLEPLNIVEGQCKVKYGGNIYEPTEIIEGVYATEIVLRTPGSDNWGAWWIEYYERDNTLEMQIDAPQGYIPPEDLTLYINPSGGQVMKIRAEAIPDYVSKTYVDNAFSEAKDEIINEVLAEFVNVSEVGQ